MKKIIVFLLILAVLIAIAFIVINIYSLKDKGNNKTGAGENFNINNDKTTGEVVKESSEGGGISGNVASGGGGGSSGGGGSGGVGGSSESRTDSETIPNQEFPADLYTKPCGYYFLEYGVCAGVCPNGQCLVDDKSCYCRIV